MKKGMIGNLVISLLFLLFFAFLILVISQKQTVIDADRQDIIRLDYSPDGNYISILLEDKIYTLDSKNYSLVRTLPERTKNYSDAEKEAFLDMVWLPDSKSMVTVQKKGEKCGNFSYYNQKICVERWVLKDDLSVELVKKFDLHYIASEPHITSSKSGKLVAIYYGYYSEQNENDNWKLSIMNLSNSEILKEIIFPDLFDISISYSSDDKYLKLEEYTGYKGNRISIYKTPEYELKYYIEYEWNDTKKIHHSSWSQNEKRMVGIEGYNESIVYFYFLELNDSLELKPIEKFKLNLSEYDAGSVEMLKPSPDFRYVAMGGSYSSKAYIAVFDKEEGRLVFFDWGGGLMDVNDVSFDWSPDSKTLVYIFDGESIINIVEFPELKIRKV